MDFRAVHIVHHRGGWFTLHRDVVTSIIDDKAAKNWIPGIRSATGPAVAVRTICKLSQDSNVEKWTRQHSGNPHTPFGTARLSVTSAWSHGFWLEIRALRLLRTVRKKERKKIGHILFDGGATARHSFTEERCVHHNAGRRRRLRGGKSASVENHLWFCLSPQTRLLHIDHGCVAAFNRVMVLWIDSTLQLLEV